MSNNLSFTKMHGAGNDFIVLDCTIKPFSLTKKKIKQLSNRQKGIGFDQLLIVEKPVNSKMDFKYRIFNSDGGEVEQCGNGARCFAVFVIEKGLFSKNTINVETNTGEIILNINKDKTITVDMGKPIFNPKDIPINVESELLQYSTTYLNKTIYFSAISMGNPHAVLFKDFISNYNIEPEALFFQNSELFPNSVNVGFLQLIDKNHAKLRVYERGSGETLACGSGACAAIVAAIQLKKLNNSVSVELLGGVVTIDYTPDNSVFLTGHAKLVFDGVINLDILND